MGFLYVDNYGYATTIELVVVVVLVTMTKLRTNRKKNLMKQLDNAYIHFACDCTWSATTILSPEGGPGPPDQPPCHRQ